MKNYNSPRALFVPRETLEYYQQTALCSRLGLELIKNYGPTDQVLDIINDCLKNGYPSALFKLNQ